MKDFSWYLVALVGLAVMTLFWHSRTPAATRGRTVDVLAQELRLDRVQRTKVAGILSDAHQSARAIDNQLRQARQNLIRALAEGKDENEINRLKQQWIVAYTRMSALDATAFARIFAVLDASQKSRAKGAFDRIGSIVQNPPKHSQRLAARVPQRAI